MIIWNTQILEIKNKTSGQSYIEKSIDQNLKNLGMFKKYRKNKLIKYMCIAFYLG